MTGWILPPLVIPLLPCSMQLHGTSDDLCNICREHAVSWAQTKQSGLINPGHSWMAVFPAEWGAVDPCSCGLPAPQGWPDASPVPFWAVCLLLKQVLGGGWRLMTIPLAWNLWQLVGWVESEPAVCLLCQGTCSQKMLIFKVWISRSLFTKLVNSQKSEKVKITKA